MLCMGLDHAHQVTLLPPLFEEANRFRQIAVGIMRSLDRIGIGTRLPDLPGTGESLVPTQQITLDDWISALQSLGADMHYVASFRGGCILDHHLKARHIWRFAPDTGQRLVRDLRRTQLTQTDDHTPDRFERVAGNIVQTSFLEALAMLSPAPYDSLRTVQLESHAAHADVKISGSAVWRRSEPGNDPVLRDGIVNDLKHWITTCAAS